MAQDLQPTKRFHNVRSTTDSTWRMLYDHSDAYDGGSSLRIVSQLAQPASARLDLYHFASPGVGSAENNIQVSMTCKDTSQIQVALLLEDGETSTLCVVSGEETEEEWRISSQELLDDKSVSIVMASGKRTIHGWQEVTWQVPSRLITGISLLCQTQWSSWMDEVLLSSEPSSLSLSCLVGSLRIRPSDTLTSSSHSHTPLRHICVEKIDEEPTYILRWRSVVELRCVDIYLRGREHETPFWIGRARAPLFSLPREHCPSYQSSIFLLIAQDTSGHRYEPIAAIVEADQ